MKGEVPGPHWQHEQEQQPNRDDPGEVPDKYWEQQYPYWGTKAEVPFRLQVFIEELQETQQEIDVKVLRFMERSDLTAHDLALAIFLSEVVMSDIQDPVTGFEASCPPDSPRAFIGSRAAEVVARRWLEEHPQSVIAQTVAEFVSSPLERLELLQEIWPTILPKITGNLQKE